MSTQQHSEINNIVVYVFSKVIECLEENIRKQIDSRRPSNTKEMSKVQNICTGISE